MLDAFCRFPLVNAECGSAFGALLRENAFRFAYRGQGFSVIRCYFLMIPGHTVITSP
jgi:hypothetical protein